MKKTKKILRNLLLFGVICYFVVTLINQQIQINNLHDNINWTTAQITDEGKKAEQLEQTKKTAMTDEYMLKLARQRGFVYPDEKIFVDVSGR